MSSRHFIIDDDELEATFKRSLRARLICREEDKPEIMSALDREIYEFIDYLDEQIEVLIDDLADGR